MQTRSETEPKTLFSVNTLHGQLSTKYQSNVKDDEVSNRLTHGHLAPTNGYK